MASSAWLPQEPQPETSQAPIPAPPSGPSGTPLATTSDYSAPVAGTPVPQSPGVAASCDTIKESGQERIVSAPGYVIPRSAFSYSMPPAGNNSASSQLSSSNSVPQSVSPAAVVVQPLVAGLSSSAAPSFSYNVPHTSSDFSNTQQFQPKMAASAQGGDGSSASSLSSSAPVPACSSGSCTSLTSNLGPANVRLPPPLSFPGNGMPPGTPVPPGIAPTAPISSHLTVSSSLLEPSSVIRPNFAAASLPLGPSQQHVYSPYPSLPLVASSPQGLWSQPQQMGVLPRPPFLPYPALLPGPFPSPAHGMPLPSVPLPESQPSGVTPLGNGSSIAQSSMHSSHKMAGTSSMQPELPPPGTDNSQQSSEVGIKSEGAVKEPTDAWTAHKTDTGVIYYYNALTGESTYEKPASFQGQLQPDKVTVQPTPVSWEKVAGTDWTLVKTNDGKKYYYNNKTKLSSWQVPTEVAELRKKLDSGTQNEPKEHSMSGPSTTLLPEKGSAPINLNAPAINTGGRDATPLRTAGTLGSTSALDLIKKKLQDSGSPVTSSPLPALSGETAVDLNGSRAVENTVKGLQSESTKDKLKDANGDGNLSESSSDSDDADTGPTKEERIIQFKEMLKELGIAPFSKWEKELPKIVFDPRFKAIPSHSVRRSLFEHYVKTRAEEERKEKRAAQKAAITAFKQLLEEASEEIDHTTDYYSFKRRWGDDPRFEVLDRKDREILLNERILPLKKAAEEKAQAIRAAAASSFKAMLQEKGDITVNTRWSRVKDSLRSDPRYKSVRHEDREVLFNEYVTELKVAAEEAERMVKSKKEEQDKLKEREREFRKRKEREEQEMERVRLKVRRKEAVASFQALLVETIKDPQASWTESKPRLEKDPQGRATNADLDPSDIEKLFRDHIKILHERCVHEFKALLSELITVEAAAAETEDGKTVLTSWSTAKRLLKPDPRYSKMPRKDRELLWRRHVDELQRKVKSSGEDWHTESHSRSSKSDSSRLMSGSRRTHDRR